MESEVPYAQKCRMLIMRFTNDSYYTDKAIYREEESPLGLDDEVPCYVVHVMV